MEKKSNHQANVVKINEILPHTNADKLEIIKVGEYQCVSQKGQFKLGDLAVYIQPDSVVPKTEPFRFIWENYQVEPNGDVPEKRRRITVRKFRGEWSEGLLMPLSDFPELLPAVFWPYEGDDVSDTIGITHYDPDTGVESTKGDSGDKPRFRRPKTLRGWFFFILHKLGWFKQQYHEAVSFQLPTYDVEALKNFKNAFTPGEPVFVTEKIHGSNARFVYLDGKMYAGSHYYWKAPKSNCVWRKALLQNPWIEEWCKANEGSALYGELVPTQKGFNYGCKEGEVKFFVFDIRIPDGTKNHYHTKWLSKSEYSRDGIYTLIDHWVPLIAKDMPFDLDKLKTLVDGPSLVKGANHVREGIVVTPMNERHVTGLGRLILKLVSNQFLEKDSK